MKNFFILFSIFIFQYCGKGLIILFQTNSRNISASIVYVSSVVGNPANQGTIDAPLETIQSGVNLVALKYGNGSVYVSEGTYSSNYRSSGDPVIDMVEGVSIYGGYDNTFSFRGLVSIIQDLSDTGGAAAGDPDRAINSTGLSNSTVIDGFTINGSDNTLSNYSAAIYNNNSSPLIQNCIIDGGIGYTTTGIYNDNSSMTLIIDNDINGGNSGSGNSIAIRNANSSPEIERNTIDGGSTVSGLRTYAIYSSNSSPVICYNSIYGGKGGSESSTGILSKSGLSSEIYNNTISGGGSPTTDYVYGICEDGCISTIIRNNTVDGGTNSARSTTSVYIRETSTSTIIENNIIFTRGGSRRYGIYESAGGTNSSPLSVRDNDIFDCPDALYFDRESLLYMNGVNSGNFVDNADGSGTALTTPVAAGNISEIPAFVDLTGGDWHLLGPLSATGLNGITEGFGFNDDKDYTLRPVLTGWSMGAYE